MITKEEIISKIENNKKLRHRLKNYTGRYQDFGSYFSSYNNAIIVLIDHLIKDTFPCDLIAYPFLYLIKHTIEIGLKTNIEILNDYLDNRQTIKTTHSLKALRKSFLKKFKETITQMNINIEDVKEEFDRLIISLNKLINLIYKFNKSETIFRYPIDEKMEKMFKDNDTIDLCEIIKLYLDCHKLLAYTECVLVERGLKKYKDDYLV